jgi:hypothetical protein
MKKPGTMLIILAIAVATVAINDIDQANLDRRLASGERIKNPICAVNFYYNETCTPPLTQQ